MPLLVVHAAVDERILCQLFQTSKIRIGAHKSHESFVKVIGQSLSTPNAGIVVGDHYGRS